ncbi:uncharacterized protein [Antedon mediterranea]|uniref:uncharacterized protein n=1 Tax=Antedon mediterranea TaxID=105859 RepID=UPI003AF4267C
MDKLYEYMEERGIEEEYIQRMRDEKIDSVVIVAMTDEDLSKFIPLLGDRIAVREFCKDKRRKGKSKKETVLQKLKQKLNKRRDDEEDVEEDGNLWDTRSSTLLGNKNAQKTNRKIDIGWLDYDAESKCFKQVRKQKGGGTRQLIVPKSTNYNELLEIATNLFFKDGLSFKGKLSEFNCKLCDFRQHPLKKDMSVGELYAECKMAVLRFYLQTTPVGRKDEAVKRKRSGESSDDDDGDNDVPLVEIDHPTRPLVQPDTPTVSFKVPDRPTDSMMNLASTSQSHMPSTSSQSKNE